MFAGTGSTEAATFAASVIAVIVGLFVWRRHTADRRARVFLWLAISELAFFLPAVLMLFGVDPDREGATAWPFALMLVIGGFSSVLFFHFGMSFPHRRPWLRRDRIRTLYLIALVLGVAPSIASVLMPGTAAAAGLLDAVLIVFGPLAMIGAIAACIAVYRSYREMTAEERRTYRAPVMGVLGGMIGGLLVDVLLGAAVESGNYRVALTANVFATAAALLLPLFFFTAATKFKLLERHSQEYVSKS